MCVCHPLLDLTGMGLNLLNVASEAWGRKVELGGRVPVSDDKVLGPKRALSQGMMKLN